MQKIFFLLLSVVFLFADADEVMTMVVDAGSSGVKFALYTQHSSKPCVSLSSNKLPVENVAEGELDDLGFPYNKIVEVDGTHHHCPAGGLVFEPTLANSRLTEKSIKKLVAMLLRVMHVNTPVRTSGKVKWQVIGGATAGNRIVDDEAQQENWYRFNSFMQMYLPKHNPLHTLHGTEEAMAEHYAVNYGSYGSCKNFISAGGSSAQMSFCLPGTISKRLQTAIDTLESELTATFPVGGCNIESTLDSFYKIQDNVIYISFLAGNTKDASSPCVKNKWFYFGGQKECASNVAEESNTNQKFYKSINPKTFVTDLMREANINAAGVEAGLDTILAKDEQFKAIKKFALVYNSIVTTASWYAVGSFNNVFGRNGFGADSILKTHADWKVADDFGFARMILKKWMNEMDISPVLKAAESDWTFSFAEQKFAWNKCDDIYLPTIGEKAQFGKKTGNAVDKCKIILPYQTELLVLEEAVEELF